MINQSTNNDPNGHRLPSAHQQPYNRSLKKMIILICRSSSWIYLTLNLTTSTFYLNDVCTFESILIFWTLSTTVFLISRLLYFRYVSLYSQSNIPFQEYYNPFYDQNTILEANSLNQNENESGNTATSNEAHMIQQQSAQIWREAFHEQMRVQGVNSNVMILSGRPQSGKLPQQQGLTKKQIKQLQTSYFTEEEISQLDEDDSQCSICLQRYEAFNKLVSLPCQHYFHKHCIQKWLLVNHKCPLCRHSLKIID